MNRIRALTVLVAVLLGACADAGLRREVASLRGRVEELERERRSAGLDGRLARLEKFLGPYINAPPPPPEPDPALTYSVPVGQSPSVGAADAPVTLVFAFDYACPYCSRLRPTLAALQKRYGASLRIVYKHFIVHPKTATLPAYAACAASRQGRFSAMDELLWTRGFEKGGYSTDLVHELADALKLDRAQFDADFVGEACKKLVSADMDVLQQLGITGTPASFVNGRFLGGALPSESFEALIEEELAKAKARIAAGTPAAEYYQKYVVAEGKKDVK